MAKSVRMADIAAKLGVSVVSVSKALAGRDGVSDELRTRIVELAEEMGYKKQTEAEHNIDNWKSIGILVADRFFNENAFYYNLYKEILTSCQQKDIVTFLEIVNNDAEQECRIPTLVSTRRVDGIIYMGDFADSYLEAVNVHGLPFVFLDFFKDSINADCVLSDNVHGGFCMTEHMIQRGRKRICFVGSVHATNSIMDRYLGYVKALRSYGLQPQSELQIEDRDENGLFIPFELPEEMPDAFVCTCDEVAYNLVEHLKGLGYTIPDDMSVSGYDDYRFSTLSHPNLTTYTVNVKLMAEAAVSTLSNRFARIPSKAPIMVVPGKLVVREST